MKTQDQYAKYTKSELLEMIQYTLRTMGEHITAYATEGDRSRLGDARVLQDQLARQLAYIMSEVPPLSKKEIQAKIATLFDEHDTWHARAEAAIKRGDWKSQAARNSDLIWNQINALQFCMGWDDLRPPGPEH